MAAKKFTHGHSTQYVRLQKNYCFACGKNNPDGMRLRFTYDEKRNCYVSRFRLDKRYTGPLATVMAASLPLSSTKPWAR